MKSGSITLAVGLVFLLAGVSCTLPGITDPYVYKFGNNYGTVVQVLEGTILPLVFQTYRQIEVPPGMMVTYVEVQVTSLSPPKVDYSSESRQVSIAFSVTQLSLSHYTIIVKALPIEESLTEEILNIN